MLSSVTIEGFKSYRAATLKLAPLTVLIGANASGKSNAIEALRLLSWIAQGNRLGSIRHALREDDRAVRGTVRDLGFRGQRRFALSCRAAGSPFDLSWDRYSIELERQKDGELRVAGEELVQDGARAPLFQVVSSQAGGGGVSVAYNNFARGGRKPRVTCTDQMAALIQLQTPARFAHGHKKAQKTIPEAAKQCQTMLSAILFLDPRPSAMRKYAFKTDPLAGDGAGLSGVLHALCEREEVRRRLLRFVKDLPEQDIANIGFVGTERDEVMVTLTETFGGKENAYDATLLSDGTLRVLATAAAVLSAPEGSLVVIEEIDNGVHPSRAGRLLERLSRAAQERDLRILISSHNPALLDALPTDAVPDVVFCYRDSESGASRLTRLEDIADYPALIAQGAVGRLMTRGIIERFVKTRPGPEERKRRARAWLAELRQQAG